MVTFNHTAREMVLKLVYYGPGLCGKTTNLLTIHERMPEKDRTKMVSINTDTDRTLFFDMMGVNVGKIYGFKTKVQLFTVPGQVFYNETRKLVLNGADGVVFVADSQAAVMDSNIESLENLAVNLKKNGYSIEAMPLVFQWNKQDMASALPPGELAEALNPEGRPAYSAVAITGRGVFETLKSITKLTVEDIRSKYFVDGRLQEDRLDLSGSTRKGAKRPQPDVDEPTNGQPGEFGDSGPSDVGVVEGAEPLNLDGVDETVARGLVESHRQDPEPSLASVPEAGQLSADPSTGDSQAGSGSLALEQESAILAPVVGPTEGELENNQEMALCQAPTQELPSDDDPTEPGRAFRGTRVADGDLTGRSEIALLAPPVPVHIPAPQIAAGPSVGPTPGLQKPLVMPRPVIRPPVPSVRPAIARPVVPKMPSLSARPAVGKTMVVLLPQGLVALGEVLTVSVRISQGEKTLGQVVDTIQASGIGEGTPVTLRITQER